MGWGYEEGSSDTLETEPESPAGRSAEEPHENLLARALSSITFDEQQSAIHDIHGVSTNEEDPRLVERRLMEMEEEISRIQSKDAYLKAKAISPQFVQNREFRLMFLATDRTANPKSAAARFVRHFEIKKELFGEEKLGREIMMSDLEPGDYESIQTRWLEHRDRSGRLVLFWTPNTHEQSPQSKLRLMFWNLFLMLKDEETRKNGMVLIFYNVGSTRIPDRKFCFALRDFIKGIPNPFVSFHICYDNPRVRPILSLVLATVGTFLTVRCRSHYGTARDCIYSLMTFGIPREALPITEDGRIIPVSEEVFANRLARERQPTPKELVVIVPGRFDVLLGRQKRCQDHVGNLRYRHLVLSYQDEYENANKNEKTAIAEKIVKEVKEKGHFLEMYYGDFIEVSDMVARKKVAHAFRSQRRLQNRRRESLNRASPGSASPDLIFSGSESDSSIPVFTPSSQVVGFKRANEATMIPNAKRSFGGAI